MRIAVSGTHCTGKSTLIDEFLRAHTEFVHEPEPYTVLVDDFGEEFAAEPCVEDFYRQLEFNVDRLRLHARGERVIYERCPIDFLAYIAVLDSKAVEPALGLVTESIQQLDRIVYLPLDDNDDIDVEYPKLRRAVDRRLSTIYREDEFGIVSASGIEVIEAIGTTEQRLRSIKFGDPGVI